MEDEILMPPDICDHVVTAMRADPLGEQATVIGEVVNEDRGMVIMKTSVGGKRVVDMPAGEQLPRIC